MGILIIIAFLAVIYGMYLKISTDVKKTSEYGNIFSLELSNNEKIKNIEVLDKNTVFVLIQGENSIKGIVYDINKNEIITFINR